MANFCLPPQIVDRFKKGLISGEINPEKLSAFSSAERHAFFEQYVGPNQSQAVNALFESKLLLKNKQQGMINWAKKIVGISEVARRDIISKIQGMDKVLVAKDEQAFLNDLVNKKLGIEVTFDEAKNISDLSKRIVDSKTKIVPSVEGGRASPSEMDYGRSRVALLNYIADLKAKAEKITLAEVERNPVGATVNVTAEAVNMSKAVESTLDNSYIGRQGLKMAWTHPSIWFKRSIESFGSLVKTFGGQQVMDEVKAYIMSRPDYINGNFKKMNLGVDAVEEVFASNKLEKIPGIGRVIKGADVAFTSQAYLSRVDAAELLLRVAKNNEGKPSLLYGRSGTDFTNPDLLTSIGKLVNSLTGRGHLGIAEPAGKILNILFFSARFAKSQIDTLTLHAFDANFSRFARVQAAQNLFKIVGGVATTLAVANLLRPGSVETDPTSADFGKIKVGKTRIDISGGLSSFVVLGARLIRGETKNSSTGKVTKLNTGKFGSPTSVSVVGDFLQNKLSPGVHLAETLLTGLDRSRKPISPLKAIRQTYTPIPIQNAQELMTSHNGVNPLAGIILDGLGLGTNTY